MLENRPPRWRVKAKEEGVQVHLNPYIALAGLIVGFVVGMTGMGGGALMTPILVLIFHVEPLAAVSSDLVASMVMKPIGAAVHLRRGTVHWELVRWLMLGSIPSAFAGVFVLRLFGDSARIQNAVKVALGVALMFAAATIVAKSYLQARRRRAELAGLVSRHPGPLEVNVPLTVLTGALGGLVVGMTSVGSGSLIIVTLMLLYPALSGRELVGTDLVQAVPLVASAAIAHILFGDFQLGLTASLLLGSLPGVYFGAKVSSRAPDVVVRPALAFVLVASGLKLLTVPTAALGWSLLALALAALALWGAFVVWASAKRHPRARAAAPANKELVVSLPQSGDPVPGSGLPTELGAGSPSSGLAHENSP